MNFRINQLNNGNFIIEEETTVSKSSFFGLIKKKEATWVRLHDIRYPGSQYQSESLAKQALINYCIYKQELEKKAKEAKKYVPKQFTSEELINLEKHKEAQSKYNQAQSLLKN